jgi:type IX secretion system PorP/SprF family membrane protein
MRRFIILLFLSALILSLKAQDIHFSQFYWSHLNLNPGNTGNFNGDYRFNGNFKNQWSSIAEPYRTFSISAEAKSLIKSDKSISIGFIVYNDEAGIGELKTNQVAASVSKRISLNSDSSLIVRAGLQFGLLNRSINFDALSFDNQYNGINYNPNRSSGENFENNNINSFILHSGLQFDYRIENRKKVNIGIAAFNLNAPNQSFDGTKIKLDRRLSVNFGADYYLTNKIDILPSVLFSKQGKFKEAIFGSNFRYHINNNEVFKRNLYAGLFYRNKDAFIIDIGMDYNQWLVGLSYDINLSNLNVATNNRGGLEISVTYIIKEFKPQIRKYKLCPKFM